MSFYPHRLLQPGEINIYYYESTCVKEIWENQRTQTIDKLWRLFEGYAFQLDWVILGPIQLHFYKLTKILEEAITYRVRLSSPMIRAQDWEQGIVKCKCFQIMCPYKHVM